jgi:hypothetical protein
MGPSEDIYHEGGTTHHFNLRGRTFYDKGPFRPVARPGASGTIGQQVVPPRGQAAAAFVGMKAICRSLNLNFRIETSRPCTNARRPREFRGMELHEVCHTRR